jgi:hypothetical protein
MTRPFAILFTAVVIAAIAGQHQLGFGIDELSHSAGYNRFGYGLLALVLLESLPLKEGVIPSVRATVLEGAISGFLLGTMCFVKPTQPIIGALILVFSVGLGPHRPRRFAGIALGVALAWLLVGGLLVRFSYGSVVRDYLLAGEARSSSLRSTITGDIVLDMVHRTSVDLTIGRILETIVNEAPGIAAVMLLGYLAGGKGGARYLSTPRESTLLALLFCGLSIATVLTSWQWGESALLPLLAIAFATLVSNAERIAVSRTIGFVATLPFLLKAATSIAYACAFPFLHPEFLHPPRAFSAPAARSLMMAGSDSSCRRTEYVSRIEHAAAKLVSLGHARSRILVLDFSNPFPYLLDAPAPQGTGIVWHANSTISMTATLPLERMFSEADVVLVPRCAEDGAAVDILLRNYGEFLRRAYTTANEDENFVYLVRRGP